MFTVAAVVNELGVRFKLLCRDQCPDLRGYSKFEPNESFVVCSRLTRILTHVFFQGLPDLIAEEVIVNDT